MLDDTRSRSYPGQYVQSFVVLTHGYPLLFCGDETCAQHIIKMSLAITIGLSSVELCFFSFAIALLALHTYYKCRTDPLAQIPPLHWSAPFSRIYILWRIYQNRRRYAHYDAHTSHDGEILPLIRVAPNEVSIMTTQGTKIVYDGGFERTSHYTVFQNFG